VVEGWDKSWPFRGSTVVKVVKSVKLGFGSGGWVWGSGALVKSGSWVYFLESLSVAVAPVCSKCGYRYL
jgi:hypothetical protein